MELQEDGILNLTPQPQLTEEEKIALELRPGAETVAFKNGWIDRANIGNPFHGRRAFPGQYIIQAKDEEGKPYRRDMVHVINYLRTKYVKKADRSPDARKE